MNSTPSGYEQLRFSKTTPTVALVDWAHLIEDFIDAMGVSVDQFLEKMLGSWLFGYIDALQRAGVRTVFFTVSGRVDETQRFRHAPTGATVCILPAPSAYRVTRRLVPNPYAVLLTSAIGDAKGTRRAALAVLKHIAPYLATPLIELAREVRAQRCRAILCQEYEHARFDECVLLGKILRLPVFATFQGGDWQLSRVESLVRPFSLRNCAGLIIGTKAEVERVRVRYGVPTEDIARIFNPVDLGGWRPAEREESRAALGIPSDAGIVAWHGRLDFEVKGLDLLLEAWKTVRRDRHGRDLRLLLVGSGKHAGLLRDRIAATVDAGITWIDEFIHDRDVLRRYLTAADIYVFPSRHEGFPVAPVEAMACGLPVVASATPGIADILEDGERSGGMLVPAENASALARAISTLLDDEARRLELGRRARRRVEKAFSPETIGPALRSVLFGN